MRAIESRPSVNQVVRNCNFRSLSQPQPHPSSVLSQPEPEDDESDRISINSIPLDKDFESAPELADLEMLHNILQQQNARNPRRKTSFASYVERKVNQE